MPNEDIRVKVISSGLKMWQVADALGIHDGSLSRKLRKELSLEEKDKIFAAIDRVSGTKTTASEKDSVFSAIKKMTKRELAIFLDTLDQSGVVSEYVCTEKCKHREKCGGSCLYRAGDGTESIYEAFLSLDYSEVASDNEQ